MLITVFIAKFIFTCLDHIQRADQLLDLVTIQVELDVALKWPHRPLASSNGFRRPPDSQ